MFGGLVAAPKKKEESKNENDSIWVQAAKRKSAIEKEEENQSIWVKAARRKTKVENAEALKPASIWQLAARRAKLIEKVAEENKNQSIWVQAVRRKNALENVAVTKGGKDSGAKASNAKIEALKKKKAAEKSGGSGGSVWGQAAKRARAIEDKRTKSKNKQSAFVTGTKKKKNAPGAAKKDNKDQSIWVKAAKRKNAMEKKQEDQGPKSIWGQAARRANAEMKDKEKKDDKKGQKDEEEEEVEKPKGAAGFFMNMLGSMGVGGSRQSVKIRPQKKRKKRRALGGLKFGKARTSVKDMDSLWFEERDVKNPHNSPFVENDDFEGPVSDRRCTDWLWIIIFILFNALLLTVSILAYEKSNTQRLLNGIDFRGNICGVGTLKERKYQYHPDPYNEVMLAMCIEKCPIVSGGDICLYNTQGQSLDGHELNRNKYCYIELECLTRQKFCMPFDFVLRDIVETALFSSNEVIKRLAGDLIISWDVVMIGIIMSIISAYCFMRLLSSDRWTSIIVWFSVFGSIASIGAIAFFCYREYQRVVSLRCVANQEQNGCEGQRGQLFFVLTYIFVAVDCVYITIIIISFNKIDKAIAAIKETSQVLRDVPMAKNLPLMTIAVGIIIGSFFLVATVSYMSVGDIVEVSANSIQTGKVRVFEFSSAYRGWWVFAFCMFCWWLSFIMGTTNFLYTTLTQVWFFTRDKQLIYKPVKRSLKLLLTYHMGSIIFGSFVIPFIRPLRGFFKLITTRIKKKPEKKSSLILSKCCKCGILCNSSLYRYISKENYSLIVLYNFSFWRAGKASFFLINRHYRHVADLSLIVWFTILQCKLCCSLIGATFTYNYMSTFPTTLAGNDTSELEAPIVPTAFVLLVGYIFATMYEGIFDSIIDGLIQAYLMDSEMFVGAQRFSTDRLKSFMDYYNESLGNALEDQIFEVEEISEPITKKKQMEEAQMGRIIFDGQEDNSDGTKQHHESVEDEEKKKRKEEREKKRREQREAMKNTDGRAIIRNPDARSTHQTQKRKKPKSFVSISRNGQGPTRTNGRTESHKSTAPTNKSVNGSDYTDLYGPSNLNGEEKSKLVSPIKKSEKSNAEWWDDDDTQTQHTEPEKRLKHVTTDKVLDEIDSITQDNQKLPSGEGKLSAPRNGTASGKVADLSTIASGGHGSFASDPNSRATSRNGANNRNQHQNGQQNKNGQYHPVNDTEPDDDDDDWQ